MGQDVADDSPLTRARLVEYIARGARPRDAYRIGAEHEKFPFHTGSYAPVAYEPDGIRALLEGLQRYGWTPDFEGENVIALTRGAASVSLEPGGQFELSGAQLE